MIQPAWMLELSCLACSALHAEYFHQLTASKGGRKASTINRVRRRKRIRLTERGLAAIQSPRKPNGLSHCIFECLIVEASSQAQNHLSVLADRYTERCRWVFDCTGDGQCDNFGSGSTRWPRHFSIGSGPLLPQAAR